ncbi:hypothetical protein TREMEDRAFT_58386 [Tremella mesenterica DSM 1558]|uniref:uncharacterized protein n=1 Tax=Tremella mesenterica (strain ATCC 24925 / CBS 8224 / DSM 1558 / NBRC 9311 / NRRL Y-6157 / RJB 2259-6 / UBC 559-6) TaxID=578456 RepID=UPI0003F497E4|nr:uncharacterized protein TREMEDRAFT_58386 [Tremella mesenterica DSM 1558]EIW72225.1 hypothetical protein TREMEDRAFT_58386 [Tremella mesenterica DSM 1558]
MEAKLQKLKVAELKELLAKHHLVQTGKKDDLVKRLLDNGINVDDDGTEITSEDPAPDTTSTAAPTDLGLPTSAPVTDSTSALTQPPADATDLTPEQIQMKARAERFGISFNPNPTSTPRPSKTEKSITTSTTSNAPAATKEKTIKIDATPKSLGISEEVLAKRAAKFGTAKKPEEPSKQEKTVEISPELAEKLRIEEEKKRKRAEKFGTAQNTTSSNGANQPDPKKVKE